MVHGDGQLQTEPWHADDGHQAEGGGECAEVGRVEPPGGQHRDQVGQAVDEDAGQGDTDSRRAQSVGPSAGRLRLRGLLRTAGSPGAHVMSDRAGVGARRVVFGIGASATAGSGCRRNGWGRRIRRGSAYGSSSGGGGKPESAQGDDDRELQQGVGVPLRRLEVGPPGEQDERAGEPRLDGPSDRPGPAWVGRPGQAAWAGYRQHEASRDQQAADESARQHQRGGADGQQRQGSGDPTTASRYGGRRGAPGGLPGGQHREEDHHRQQDAAEQKARPVRSCPGRSGVPPPRRCRREESSPAAIRPPPAASASARRWSPPSRCWCSPARRVRGRRGDRPPVRVVRWLPRSRPRWRWRPPSGSAWASAAPGRPESARRACSVWSRGGAPRGPGQAVGAWPARMVRPASRAVRAGRGVCRGAWWSPGTRRSAASDPTRRPASGVRRGAV